MRRISVVLSAVILVAMVAGPAGAQAPARNSAACSATFVELFSPGFTLTPSSGHQESAGPGVLDCTGTIQGHRITGPGTTTNSGSYHDSTCLLDRADGAVSMVLPTDKGQLTVEGTFQVTRVGALLSVRIEMPEAIAEGVAVVVPTKGDCVLNPVTEALVLMSFGIHDRPAPTATTCDADLVVVRIGCRSRS
jgi:hypothetical protein